MNFKILEQQRRFLSESFKNSTIMVSGSTGLIGSATVKFLLDLNDRYDASINIIALYRNFEKKEFLYKDFLNRDDLSLCYVSDEAAPVLDKDIDYFIHAAGISGGTKMHLKDPEKIFSVGINGTKNMLDVAVSHNCKGFLFVSTYEIYGAINSEELITEEQPCILDPLLLRNSYAEVKRTCESMLTAFNAKYGLNVYSARISSTFGSEVNYNDPRFFAEFGRCIVEERDIVLKSSGGTIRNYLDADDAAAAFLYILAKGSSNNAYNVTNMDNALSIKEIAEMFIKISNGKSRLLFDLDDDIDKLGFRKEGKTLLNSNKVINIGWKPVYSIEDTIEKLINAMKKGL